jgi:hypothetical protein
LLDRNPGGHLEPEPDVNLFAAARSVYGSRLFWPVIAFLSILGAFGYLLPSTGPWLFAKLSIEAFVLGYQVSVARVVFLGGLSLPSPADRPQSMLRRGLSMALVLAPLSVAVSVISLGAMLLIQEGGRLMAVSVATAIWVALLFPAFVMVGARFVASDRISEAMRYVSSWRRFRAHLAPGVRLAGYNVAAGLVFLGMQRVAVRLAGLDSAYQQDTILGPGGHGSVRQVLILVVAGVVLGVGSALWQLLSSHMLGQYASAAYGDSERQPGSV